MLSTLLYSSLEIHKIKLVTELPPKQFCSSLVSLEFLYGTYTSFLINEFITIPNCNKDTFIEPASIKLVFVVPVLITFSLPAKSHNYN
jgi:hypothetical protein